MGRIPSEDQIPWKRCPRCQEEFGLLDDEFGVCHGCRHKILERAREERDALNREMDIRDQVVGCLGEQGAKDYTWENFLAATGSMEAHEAARNFNPRADNLFLFGQTGTGKTHLAACIFRDALKNGLNAVFTTPPKIMRRFRALDGADEEERLIEFFAGVPVLVVDEIGLGKATDFANQISYEVIALRILRGMNGFVGTSNIGLTALRERLGDDRLTSRLNGLCRRIHVNDIDHRAKGKTAP